MRIGEDWEDVIELPSAGARQHSPNSIAANADSSGKPLAYRVQREPHDHTELLARSKPGRETDLVAALATGYGPLDAAITTLSFCPSVEKPMRSARFRHTKFSGLVLLGLLSIATTSGCVGMMANVMHIARGNLVPPDFSGLNDRRVAVVCVSNSDAFGPTSASISLARAVGKLLSENVPDIEVVSPQRVADWIDKNDWDYVDYVAVGRGVDAEMVVAIDLDSFSLHEGKTLYKGRADLSIVVYDLAKNGEEVFAVTPPQVQFPVSGGQHTTDLAEDAFRRQFLMVISSRIARHFYAYDAKEDYARDVTLVNAG